MKAYTAKLIKDNLKGFNGHAAFYQVNPPMTAVSWDDEPGEKHEFVVVSSANVEGRDETYIFPANKKGEIVDWSQMKGSDKDIYSHDAAFGNVGYNIVR